MLSFFGAVKPLWPSLLKIFQQYLSNYHGIVNIYRCWSELPIDDIDNATVWVSLWVHRIHARVKLLMETNPIFGICLYAMSDSILQQMWRRNAQIFKALALSVNLIIPPVLGPNLIKVDSIGLSLHIPFHIPQMCRVICYPFRKRRIIGEVSPLTSSSTSHILHS